MFTAGSLTLISILVLAPFGAKGRSQTTQPAGVVADSTNGSTYNLKAYSNEVQLDLVVQDGSGEPIRNLSREHFQVLEDGKPQELRFFLESRSTDVLQPAPLLPEHTYSNALTTAGTESTVVLLMDSLNTALKDQMYMRQQMLLSLQKIPAGTHIALFTLAPSLQLLGLTSDPAAIAKLISGNKGITQSSLLEDPIADEQWTTAESTQVAVTEARRAARRKDLRAGYTLDAFESLGKYLMTFKGRKSVIWFSSSFPLYLPAKTLTTPNLAQEGQPTQGNYGVGIISADYTVEVRRVMDILAANRVAVYPVDVRGVLLDPNSATVNAGMTMLSVPASVSSQDWSTSQKADFSQNVIAEHQTMTVIADGTGGQAFYNTNNLKDGFAKVIRDLSSYYAIAYVPGHRQFDEKYHNIRVTVDIPGAKVAYRRGYYADDLNKNKKPVQADLDPLQPELRDGAPQSTQIRFQARIVPTDPQPDLSDHSKRNGDSGAKIKGNVVRYGIDWTANLAAIETRLSAAGVHQGKISMGIVAYDGEGKTRNSLVNTLDFDLSSQRFTQMLASGLPLHQELDLPDGDVVLRLAMIDRTTGKTGSLQIPLQVK